MAELYWHVKHYMLSYLNAANIQKSSEFKSLKSNKPTFPRCLKGG